MAQEGWGKWGGGKWGGGRWGSGPLAGGYVDVSAEIAVAVSMSASASSVRNGSATIEAQPVHTAEAVRVRAAMERVLL